MRTAVLVTHDGVPVFTRGRSFTDAPGAQDVESLAALAVGWMDVLARTVAPLTWNAPRRVVLTCARATLVAQQASGAVLVVVLDPGASAEELRLPMEATIARLERHLRAVASGERPDSLGATQAGQARPPVPPAPLPPPGPSHSMPSAVAPAPPAPFTPPSGLPGKGPGRPPADRYPGPTFRRH
jgi:predicted regulator of Ras-like GTPase activity (Roadblock/LC7/MglB family)